LEQLKKLDKILEDRIEKARIYTKLLQGVDHIRPPVIKPKVRHTFQSYCIYVEKEGWRDKLRQDLLEKWIETQIGTYALHLEPSYADVRRNGDLKNSEKLFRNLLTLPLHHELTYEDMEYIVNSISELLKGYEA
jgi:dTDP-4-amino-4,6-dideoxygalactose transaminase